jgi:5S rRNA maturation endonuclease (ribonuclease M5)
MEDSEIISEFIKKLQSEDVPIIVEGKKDKEALEKFGVNNVHTLSGKPAYKIAEEMKDESRVILLLDLDRKGREIKSQLLHSFEKVGAKVDLRYDKMLRQTQLSHIEGLPKYIENRGGINGKDRTSISQVYNSHEDRG